MKTKKNTSLALLALLILSTGFGLVSATSICELEVELINQDPYPAVPGSYVELVFQVDGIDNPDCDGAYFTLVPSYPFSLDDDDGIRSIGGSTYLSGSSTEWMIPFKVRVDADALDGNATIGVLYGEYSASVSTEFDIEIEDARTSFDAVIQDYTDEEISIAIANTGKYTANSVVIRIPEQDGFTATSTDGQMVGNLDSGDYTIISFEVTQDSRSDDNGFDFDVYYTDELGERRVVNMELSVGSSSSTTSTVTNGSGQNFSGDMSDFGGMPGMGRSQGNSSTWIKWTSIILGATAVLVVGIVLLKKRKKSHLKKKVNKKSSGDNTPDWIKNSKAKSKE